MLLIVNIYKSIKSHYKIYISYKIKTPDSSKDTFKITFGALHSIWQVPWQHGVTFYREAIYGWVFNAMSHCVAESKPHFWLNLSPVLFVMFRWMFGKPRLVQPVCSKQSMFVRHHFEALVPFHHWCWRQGKQDAWIIMNHNPTDTNHKPTDTTFTLFWSYLGSQYTCFPIDRCDRVGIFRPTFGHHFHIELLAFWCWVTEGGPQQTATHACD